MAPIVHLSVLLHTWDENMVHCNGRIMRNSWIWSIPQWIHCNYRIVLSFQTLWTIYLPLLRLLKIKESEKNRYREIKDKLVVVLYTNISNFRVRIHIVDRVRIYYMEGVCSLDRKQNSTNWFIPIEFIIAKDLHLFFWFSREYVILYETWLNLKEIYN